MDTLQLLKFFNNTVHLDKMKFTAVVVE